MVGGFCICDHMMEKAKDFAEKMNIDNEINIFGRSMTLKRYVNDETRTFMEEQFAECLDIEQLLDLYADFQCVLRKLMHDTSKSLIEKN